MRPQALARVLVGLAVAVCLLGNPAKGLGATRPTVTSRPHQPHRELEPQLARPSEHGGCCDLRLTTITPDTATVSDADTGFSATVEHMTLGRWQAPVRLTRASGYAMLYLYVIERNQGSVSMGLVSGPGNWLLEGRDPPVSTYPAFAVAPYRAAGFPLAHIDALHADTNPTNEGWIGFRIPLRTEKRYTLSWSDCMPRCATLPPGQAFGPVADITVGWV